MLIACQGAQRPPYDSRGTTGAHGARRTIPRMAFALISHPHPRLREAYASDINRAWSSLHETYPGHEPYAVVLYGLGCGDGDGELVPYVLTEQALTEVAQDYLNRGYHDTLDEARDALRYSVPDHPLGAHFLHLAESGAVSVLMRSGALAATRFEDDEAGEDDRFVAFAEAATSALRQLDERGLFGTGATRERLLLIVIIEDGEHENDAQRSATDLNPPVVAERFRRQTHVEGAFANCETVAVGHDGICVYTAGAISNPDSQPGRPEEFLAQVAAYHRHGTLTRRWSFEFPSWGDSIRQIACPGNGESLFALRLRYEDRVPRTLVLRLRGADGRLLEQNDLPGEPASFAVGADGSRIAVAMNNGVVHLLDAELRPAGEFSVGPDASGVRFLRGGQLLIATGSGVWQLDPETAEPRQVSTLTAFRLSIDRNETMLAISRRLPILDAGPRRRIEFGAQIVSLPDFQEIRSFIVPEHQAVTAELSPDGQRLALVALSLRTVRKHFVVFNTANGREVARRRGDIIRDLSFLPDSRSLVIPTSGYTTGPPIDIWTVE